MGGYYFNTTQINGQQLAQYESEAESQNDKVLEFFEHNPRREFTSEEINAIVMPRAPGTSPRRALSTLFSLGLIEKCGKRPGKYGRPIYLWRLRADPGQQELKL